MYYLQERKPKMPSWRDKDDTKSRFSQYSMSSSVIRRNEGLSLLDNRFEKVSRVLKIKVIFETSNLHMIWDIHVLHIMQIFSNF